MRLGLAFCLSILCLCSLLQAQTPSPVTTTSGGTAGYVPVFTTGTNVENSIITQANGKVGIGTTSPGELLEIGNSGNLRVTGDNFGINVDSGGAWSYNNWLLKTAWNSTYGDLLYLAPSGNQAAGNESALIVSGNGIYLGTGSSSGTSLNTTGATVLNNGDVGIGTTSPGATDPNAKLEVSGGDIVLSSTSTNPPPYGIVFADGTKQTTAFNPALCGGDYAESVDVTGKRASFTPGDVLVIDPGHPGKFLKSAQPYSTLVAGVYSTKPGTVGRRQSTPKSPDEVPMALVGIVPVKVTAENGPIKPGDLLVTSSMAGKAMKGTDRDKLTGAVIGKSLGSLETGDGVVEVLVSLR
jgi:hypothetical protein